MEPNGATLTPEDQQWAGVLIMVCGIGGIVLGGFTHTRTPLDGVNPYLNSGMILVGACFSWSGYTRKRRK